MSAVARHVVVRGRVQGVFFRESTRRRAAAAAVSGWVANRADGTVEAVFEGDAEDVGVLVDFVRRGPPGADVERVDVVEVASESLRGFEVR
ncbi:MAG: acylphosphatase [Actinomycetota bacterium]|nr:acylphosphatase [Actinomycetota bacterium]